MRKRLLTIAAALCLGIIFITGTALADGASVEDVAIEADGVDIEAMSDKDCLLLAVLYSKDGRMLDIKSQEIKAGQSWNDKLKWTAQQAGAERVKVFLIEANETAKPMTQSCTVRVEEPAKDIGAEYVLVTGMASDMFGSQAKLLFSDGQSKVVDTAYDYSGSIGVGTLVRYSVNADHEYVLTKAVPGQSGYKLDDAVTSAEPVSEDNDCIGSLNGRPVYGNAVIFVRYLNEGGDGYRYRVVKGTKLMKQPASLVNLNSDVNTMVLSGDIQYVEMAYVDLTATQESADFYGYVT